MSLNKSEIKGSEVRWHHHASVFSNNIDQATLTFSHMEVMLLGSVCSFGLQMKAWKQSLTVYLLSAVVISASAQNQAALVTTGFMKEVLCFLKTPSSHPNWADRWHVAPGSKTSRLKELNDGYRLIFGA